MKLNKLFITCPIFYVNAKPHLGHAYTLCLADAWARYARLRESPLLKPFSQPVGSKFPIPFKKSKQLGETYLSAGTDEHGLKVKQAAQLARVDPHVYCDEISPLFRATNGPVMLECSGRLFDVKASGSLPSYHRLTYLIFEPIDMDVFLADSSSQSMWKEKSHMLVDTINDVSVSRPRGRLDWGIQVPDHPDQVIYVWLDALVNYLTVSGFPWSSPDFTPVVSWPPDFQFIGKDILRFHAVLWPALLMAVDLPLPKHLICHCHLLIDNVKMSKSRHNVLDPFEEQRELTPRLDHVPSSAADCEGLRYVLLRSALLNSDASYCRKTAKQLIDTELVNCLGNLLSRITSKRLNPNQSVVRMSREEAGVLFNQFSEDSELLESLDTLAVQFDQHWWVHAQPHLAIERVIGVLRQTNALIDRHKPWRPGVSSVEPEHIVSLAAESLRLAGLLLQPVVPNLAARLLQRLGLEETDSEESRLQLQNKYFWTLGEDHGPLLTRLA
ncbi:hypothetical protein PHET_08076 [Paragonimus heterotremus]|uniref:Methionine--tRNA ligase, mitochondrial n=1 Tax=Paragonimus heterotremus TaxID=100268 RepID=A0A8J4WF94_9TREM|nr:hypothetical protein PHET_08076 [Paragonimus heterotremus]